jgi:putative hydrolase of the HAD superfamily
MKIRAVIFDIYNTLLEIGPPPPDAEARWMELCRGALGAKPRLDLKEFAAACQAVIAQEHAAARHVGIAYPEIFWPAVVGEALPELARLKPKQLEVFLIAHAALQRSVRLMPGVADVLRTLSRDKVLLGLVSNSQPYTLAELDGALTGAGLRFKIFRPELTFLSFEAGFSKPEPHVFRWLAARLRNCAIATGEALIVGDRLDNDIEPAHAQGFQTWHLTAGPSAWPTAGDWKDLSRHLHPAR